MNPYTRFQRNLRLGFRIHAQPQIRSLWADLLELEETSDPRARSALIGQARRRVRALGRAARATDCRDVEAACEAFGRALTAGRLRDRQVLDGLSQQMNKLAEAVYGVRGSTAASGRACSPAAPALAASHAG